MNKAKNYFGFRWACKKGHLEIIKYLFETFKDTEMNKANNYYGFIIACINGHLEIL